MLKVWFPKSSEQLKPHVNWKSRYNQSYKTLNLSKFEKWRDILEGRIWNNLNFLILTENSLTDKDFLRITKLMWPQLKHLKIDSNNLTDQGIESIKAKEFPNLVLLQVGKNSVNLENMLLQCLLSNIRLLDLSYNNPINPPQNIYPPLQGFSLPNLQTLKLDGNKISLKIIKKLIKIDLVSLKQLSLSNCQIGNTGIKTLMKGNWLNLNKFEFANNEVQLEGFNSMYLSCWGKLKFLNIMFSLSSPISSFQLQIPQWNLAILYGSFSFLEQKEVERITLNRHDDFLAD